VVSEKGIRLHLTHSVKLTHSIHFFSFNAATWANTIKKNKEKESRADTPLREREKTKKRRREEFVVGFEDHLRAGHHTLRCKK
jgi:hypothetical protein